MNSQAIQSRTRPEPSVKGQQSLRILSRILLAMSICIFTFETIAVSITTRFAGPSPPCGMATGIWVGVLVMITSGLGMGAFHSPYGHKCLMVSHFVMCIVGMVADGILILFTTICLITLPRFATEGYNKIEMATGFMWLEFLLWMAGVTHFITSIVSSAFLCHHWCQDKQPLVTMVNLPRSAVVSSGGNGYEQNVVIEQLPVAVPRQIAEDEVQNNTTE